MNTNESQTEFADPGYQGDGRKRMALGSAASIREAWWHSHRPAAGKLYTGEQLRRIRARIRAAWNERVDVGGPPAPDNTTAMAALRREVVLARANGAPDPDPDESHDDFIDRCIDALTGDDSDLDEDAAEEACELAWEDSGEASAGPVMHKTHAAKTTGGAGMEFVLSDATPDRFGDVIEPAGWRLENFARNPIALFGHDKSFVIGKWTNLRIGATDLRGELELAPKGVSPRIDEIRKLIDADILRAVSVGFIPLQDEPIDPKDPWKGTRYTAHELVETSIVAVPANPNALAVARSLAISPSTVRMIFGEPAGNNVMQREFIPRRGEPADTTDAKPKPVIIGEHAAPSNNQTKDIPMLLSQRIQAAEKNLLALQDNLDANLAKIDDANPNDEQMALTGDLTGRIERANRHLATLKAAEALNGANARPADELASNGVPALVGRPAGLKFKEKTVAPLDYLIRAAIVRCRSKSEGVTIDDMRRKVYGDDEGTRVMCDLVLKAATAPAMTTVPTWAQELVRTAWVDFMEALLPMSVYPRLSGMGLALTFGANGRLVIPTRNLTPSIAGAFVGEGAPIPVKQGAFASQTLTPKKMAVITTWTREMGEYSTPSIEGLLRQAVLEDTAISLDTALLDINPATAIRPPGLRSYGAGLTASAVAGNPFANFVADYKALYGALLASTAGNVRRPVMILNPTQTTAIGLIQPPAAAAPLFPFIPMIEGGRLLKAEVIESATVAAGQAILVDAADFTTAGAEGPQMEISDQTTLHLEDTTPADIVSGPAGTPVAATPVKSMFQTDSLALRMIMRMNWLMRRPVVAWMTGVQWG